jgi:arylsulfatase
VKRPNILLILVDQHRGDSLSIEGHPALLTPTMDSIARNGVRFSRCYSTCPVCIPARRSILSGQFPATHGMVGYQERVEWDAPATLPGELTRAGYQTALVGRCMHQYPARKRFGYGQMRTQLDYAEWMRRRLPDVRAPSGEHSSLYYSSGVMHNDWTARPWPYEEELHPTNWTVNEALRFLETRDPSCPFFLTVSFIAPHPPLVPPAFYLERYLRLELPQPVIGSWAVAPGPGDLAADPAPFRVHLEGEALRSCRAGYYGLINHLDDQIRRLLNPVDGVQAMTGGDTVVLYSSDHGEMLGDHYLWRKSMPYEGASRVPLLLSAPERFGFARGSTFREPVCLEDLMPTLLDIAGAGIPESVEGRSVLPLCRREAVEWREHVHIEHAPTFHALTDGKTKYVWLVETGREQLFDLDEDPAELRDLAGEPGRDQLLRGWRARLARELADRPEGFSDGSHLVPGQTYRSLIPGRGRNRPAAP